MPTLSKIDVDEQDATVGTVTASRKKRKASSILEELKRRVNVDDDDDERFLDESPEKKRKKSILEELNGDDRSHAASEGKENAKAAASDAGAASAKKAPKKRTIRDFYSLSPKGAADGSDATPVPTDASATKLTPKKRRVTGKFIALNEDAAPINVHIAFAGDDKPTAMRIESHCVDSKFDVGGKPIELTGKYDPRTKAQIERFLGGFGRYIH